MSEVSELDKMIPEPVKVHAGGEDLTLAPMKVKQLSAVLKAIQPFLAVFSVKKKDVPLDVLAIFTDHTDSAISLVATLTGKTPEWVGELQLDEVLEVFSKVLEVNLDFFTRKVFPMMAQAMGTLSQGMASATSINGPEASKP